MFMSGSWDGFWQQLGWGRQSMEAFELKFNRGKVEGGGKDIIGPFVVRGEFDKQTGQITFRKMYLGRHTVHYEGKPDGEGCILGTWQIDSDYGETKGPFMIKPVIENKELDFIKEIKPKNKD